MLGGGTVRSPHKGRAPDGGITVELKNSHFRVDNPEQQTPAPSRVRIDRFTQGVVPAALFDEEPWFGGETCIRLELRNPCEGETGLFLLLVKDLITGDLPVGGTASVGRGILAGRAKIRLPDSFEADIEPGPGLPQPILKRLDQEIRSFHEAPPRNRDQEVRNG